MPARAGRHDHSTQHLTDPGVHRVRAGTGDGLVVLGWDYPGSTLLQVRILRSEREAARDAEGGAGQEVVYDDVTGSFRDRAVENGRDCVYSVFARDVTGGDWVPWGEYRLRPGQARGGSVRAVAGRAGRALHGCFSGVTAALVVALFITAALAGAAAADDPSPTPSPGSAGGAAKAGQLEWQTAAQAAATADPAVAVLLAGASPRVQYSAWDEPPDGGAPTGVTIYYDWPAAQAKDVAAVWPLVATAGDQQVPVPPYTQYDRRLRVHDLTGLRVDVLLRSGVIQLVPYEGATPFELVEQTWAPFSWLPWFTERPWVLAPVFLGVGIVLVARAWRRSRAWNRRLPSMTRHDRQFVGRLLVLVFLAVGLVWQVYEAWYAATKPMVEAGGAQANDLAALPLLLIAPGLFLAALVLELSSASHRVAWALLATLATAASVFNLAMALTSTTTNLNLTYYISLAVLALIAIPRAFSAGKMGWSRSFAPRYG
jgi:hypothetical protein